MFQEIHDFLLSSVRACQSIARILPDCASFAPKHQIYFPSMSQIPLTPCTSISLSVSRDLNWSINQFQSLAHLSTCMCPSIRWSALSMKWIKNCIARLVHLHIHSFHSFLRCSEMSHENTLTRLTHLCDHISLSFLRSVVLVCCPKFMLRQKFSIPVVRKHILRRARTWVRGQQDDYGFLARIATSFWFTQQVSGSTAIWAQFSGTHSNNFHSNCLLVNTTSIRFHSSVSTTF